MDAGNRGMSGVLRVYLVDAHPITRRGIKDLLSDEPDIVVIGEAATAAQALAQLGELQTHVVIAGDTLPDASAPHLCSDLSSTAPHVRCLVLAGHAVDAIAFDVIRAGAAGMLLNDVSGPELVAAVRDVAAGKTILGAGVSEAFRQRMLLGDDPLGQRTSQERRVLDLIGHGKTNREISRQLHLAEKTVKNYVSSVLAKLGLQNRAQAAVFIARAELPTVL